MFVYSNAYIDLVSSVVFFIVLGRYTHIPAVLGRSLYHAFNTTICVLRVLYIYRYYVQNVVLE